MPAPPPASGLPRAPAALEPVYRVFAERYSRPGLPLATYPGRWLAFRAAEATRPNALALGDEEAAGVAAWVEFRARAIEAAGGGEVVLVKLARHAFRPPGRDAGPAATEPDVEVLSIIVESSTHRVGLMGGVVLDGRGHPSRVHEPLPLLLDWDPR